MRTSEHNSTVVPPAIRENPKEWFKDEVLDSLGQKANIAQFVSFAPDLEQRYSSIQGFRNNHGFSSVEEAAGKLLMASAEKSVNVRSFLPSDPKSHEFIYGLTKNDDVASAVMRLSAQGLYTIVNETIDVNDGGVSGVSLGGVVEFAPQDTPRCVEKPGTVAFSHAHALKLLECVYGFKPNLSFDPEVRVEFSVHPKKRGVRCDHTIIWEIEDVGPTNIQAHTIWPNRFSKFIGDKAFGLLVANLIGMRVPRTTVIARAVSPFTFGKRTGSSETWIRTCPTEQVPGRFTTHHGWLDPFKLISDEDPEGTAIASILAQEGIVAAYSGALVSKNDGTPIIEGSKGSGDVFMLGLVGPEDLPSYVVNAVDHAYKTARKKLGPVRFEWVFDGKDVWIVQMHYGTTETTEQFIYPGDAARFHEFEVSDGIDALRLLIGKVRDTGDGIVLNGNIGVTSHLGDLLRKAKIPSFITHTAA
jgi:hypothetical protein